MRKRKKGRKEEPENQKPGLRHGLSLLMGGGDSLGARTIQETC